MPYIRAFMRPGVHHADDDSRLYPKRLDRRRTGLLLCCRFDGPGRCPFASPDPEQQRRLAGSHHADRFQHNCLCRGSVRDCRDGAGRIPAFIGPPIICRASSSDGQSPYPSGNDTARIREIRQARRDCFVHRVHSATSCPAGTRRLAV